MGASPAAVNDARGAKHAPAERRVGAPHVAENVAATEAVAHDMQEGAFVMVFISGEALPAVFARSLRHRLDGVTSPGAAGLEHTASP